MNELWQKLECFEVTSRSDKLSFTARLAKENDWSVNYAEKVYKEYLKFIYLAATAGQQVTPSEDVDQAWHLHLCYSRSYWGEFCEGILNKRIHHGPTKGGKTESNRFIQQYESTLQLYKGAFGPAAPNDIWPPAELRFDTSNQFVRVNKKDSFIIRKRTLYLTLVSSFGVLFLSGCSEFFEGVIEGDPTYVLPVFAGIFFIIILFRFYAKEEAHDREPHRKNDDNGGGSDGDYSGDCGGGCGGD